MEYNPRAEAYWDAAALETDMKAAFAICNGCRLCYNLCPAFPSLFRAVEGHDDAVEALTGSELEQVADLCYQCKLCFVKCPYVPPHPFDLDFPRLMLRYKAVRARRQGIGRTDRFLGDPERVGRLGHLAPGLANWGNRNPTLRRAMARILGIDPRRRLPRFPAVRFSEWLQRQRGAAALTRAAQEAADADVVIFTTCTVEYHEPGIGQAALAVLAHNGIRAAVPEGQRCCGMPALDGGDIAAATAKARANVELLAPYARAGKKILALQPTCAMVLKQEYRFLLGTPEAEAVAAATEDITEYLARALKEGRLKREFPRAPARLTYHLSCHTKAQGLNRAGRDLLSATGAQVTMVDHCAGIDGTWGLKAAFYDESQKVAAKMTAAFRKAHEVAACGDCALAGLQIQVATDRPPRHPVEILAEAYGLTGADAAEGQGREVRNATVDPGGHQAD
ncbi:Ferredoxin [Candidatus Hydrogenisulfobacillus filiaventi]|uniref:Ferredoxin n=1 Tax=Candidatus Hydrogenisulfobacillus filiaventi TaxID=2707344 RepID=A0A6F8ZHC7_9FIRM|nr:heterodisulfide reductase-related iron-sulfur binding cluster [Bacillota bacterium]CAB1129287.1 Ferredoxin [Candidatus Hydrogenisulfobacillus filiaventi]